MKHGTPCPKSHRGQLSGAINTGLNFTEAALGEIPVMGGIIALVMAFMRGMNAAMLAAAPAVAIRCGSNWCSFEDHTEGG